MDNYSLHELPYSLDYDPFVFNHRQAVNGIDSHLLAIVPSTSTQTSLLYSAPLAPLPATAAAFPYSNNNGIITSNINGLFDTAVPLAYSNSQAQFPVANARPNVTINSHDKRAVLQSPESQRRRSMPVFSPAADEPQPPSSSRKSSLQSRKRSFDELSVDGSMDSLIPSSPSLSPSSSPRLSTVPPPQVGADLQTGSPNFLATLLERQSKIRQEVQDSSEFDSEKILRQNKQLRNKMRSILGKLKNSM